MCTKISKNSEVFKKGPAKKEMSNRKATCRFVPRQPVEITADDLKFKVQLFNDSISPAEREANWRGCAKIRMKDIRGRQIFESWPQYKSPQAYRLVNSFLFLFSHSYAYIVFIYYTLLS